MYNFLCRNSTSPIELLEYDESKLCMEEQLLIWVILFVQFGPLTLWELNPHSVFQHPKKLMRLFLLMDLLGVSSLIISGEDPSPLT